MKDLIPLFLFGAITAIIIYTSSRRHKERLELIRRGMNPVSPPGSGGFALFLGLGGAAIGLALIVSAILVARGGLDREMLTGGIITFFGGAAFLLYWKLTAGDREKAFRAYEKAITPQDAGKMISVDDENVEKSTQNPE